MKNILVLLFIIVSNFIFAQNVQFMNSANKPNINNKQILAVNNLQNFSVNRAEYQLSQQAFTQPQISKKTLTVSSGNSVHSVSNSSVSEKVRVIKNYRKPFSKNIVKKPEKNTRTVYHIKKKSRIKRCPSF